MVSEIYGWTPLYNVFFQLWSREGGTHAALFFQSPPYL